MRYLLAVRIAILTAVPFLCAAALVAILAFAASVVPAAFAATDAPEWGDAIPPPPGPGPDYEVWLVTCWEGDVEVVYDAIAWTPPTWQTNAWRLTLLSRERIITSAPCRVTP